MDFAQIIRLVIEATVRAQGGEMPNLENWEPTFSVDEQGSYFEIEPPYDLF